MNIRVGWDGTEAYEHCHLLLVLSLHPSLLKKPDLQLGGRFVLLCVLAEAAGQFVVEKDYATGTAHYLGQHQLGVLGMGKARVA